jgi:hypothetical protein
MVEGRTSDAPPSTGFVELPGAQLLAADSRSVVEVVDCAGARLTIRVSAQALDVAAVVAAFRGSHR